MIRPAKRLYARHALAAAIVLTAGCGYGPMSPEAYQYAQALVAITNRQASDKLEGVRGQIDGSLANGTLSEKEANWLRAIIDRAQRGEWADAQRDARRMMEDQVRR